MASMTAPATTAENDWTVGRLLSWTSDYLTRHSVDDARLAAEVLLANAAGWRRIDLYARFDRVLEAEPMARFRKWVRRAATHEPVAYLVGEKEFFSLSFRVTRDVLIPRPETETLVECLMDYCREVEWVQPRILDVGTGSGCLAIAALTNIPEASAVATDVSQAALEIARFNAERHKVLERLALLCADRLALPAEAVPEGGFNVLVCNPPYIAAGSIPSLDAAVRDFEPPVALTDGGDGLSFYRTIAVDAPALLAEEGVVIVEVGDGQHEVVQEVMTGPGRFVHHQTRHDRVVGQGRALVFTRASCR